MLNNFRNLQSLYESLGARWLMFRVGYALRMRTGFIRKQMPAYNWKDRPLETWLKRKIPSKPETYAQWRKQNSATFFFKEAKFPSDIPWNPKHVVNEAERVLNGELKYFEHQFINTGFPPDWHQVPTVLQPPSSAAGPPPRAESNSTQHWSEISDDGDIDIKFIWEASRFSMVFTLVRAYASTQNVKFAEAFWKLLQSWAESNSPNTGPNWMDGQEAALRLMAWTFGFYAFIDSSSSTPERIAQFTVMVAAHAERIHKNIGYAISTHSNHTISEAFGLWLVGLLFPELKDAEKYFSLGRKLLEQEAAAQIFPDGGYSMYSLNYHRFILHIYFYAMRLGELNGTPFSESVKGAVTKSVDYLYQLIDSETGQMPVYGSNDGALVLPLNNCDFTDYRPLLQLGSYITQKRLLFERGAWDEALFWLCGSQALTRAKPGVHNVEAVEWAKGDGQIAFPQAGVYLVQDTNSKAIIRCTDFRSRPSHADQLHVDLWLHDQNIACDPGTYLYSGPGIWRNGLAHTSVHNTVIVDDRDQMRMVSRFTWTDWARGKILRHDENIWQGEHDGYERLADPVNHERTVLSLEEDRWLIIDRLRGKQPHHYALHWLLNDFPYEQRENGILLSVDLMKYKMQVGVVEGNTTFTVVRGDPVSTRGWRSRYYGQKEPAISVRLEVDQPYACFWTFFGFEDDAIELAGNTLAIHSPDWKTRISLAESKT
jgi:Heparinase II/III-like protein/Heparinase II/III N-terminus